MYSLVSFRYRAMQTQLFPQLVEPIVRLIAVQPTDFVYTLNLDCQKSAL